MSNDEQIELSNKRKVLSMLSNSQSKPVQSNIKSFFDNSKNNKSSKNTTPQPTPLENQSQNNASNKNLNSIELSLKNALKEAVEENETLRNRVIELEALYAAAEDEIEKKDKAICELYELLQRETSLAEKNVAIDKMNAFFKDSNNLITQQPTIISAPQKKRRSSF